MMTVRGRNVNSVYVDGLWWLKTAGKMEDSRYGDVLVSPEPVITIYERPLERVLFDSIRDCNPFFHLYEAVWMLAGDNRVAPLLHFNKNMEHYAHNGKLNGAYGYRWIKHFQVNQIMHVIELLRNNPKSRQAVITMWDPDLDTNPNEIDVPCNTHCYFRITEHGLELTICCRSNDALWGAYGANAVHFSILQEFIANALGIPIGRMYQFSNNFHVYTNVKNYKEIMTFPALDSEPYEAPSIVPYPQILPKSGRNEAIALLADCHTLLHTGLAESKNPWLNEVVLPMITLWHTRRHTDLDRLPSCDWKVAFTRWLERREHAKSR